MAGGDLRQTDPGSGGDQNRGGGAHTPPPRTPGAPRAARGAPMAEAGPQPEPDELWWEFRLLQDINVTTRSQLNDLLEQPNARARIMEAAKRAGWRGILPYRYLCPKWHSPGALRAFSLHQHLHRGEALQSAAYRVASYDSPGVVFALGGEYDYIVARLTGKWLTQA